MTTRARFACALLCTVSTIGCTPRAEPLPDHLTFVVERIEVPTGDFLPGFDLDEMDSHGCAGAGDEVSTVTGRHGVDNELLLLGAFLDYGYDDREGRTFQEALDAQLADSADRIAVDVTGIDDGQTDQEVRVRVLVVTEESDGFHTTRALGDVSGSIHGGRLTFALDGFALPIGALLGTADLRGVRFGADLAATGLTRGELGGRVSAERVAEIARVFAPDLTDADVDLIVSADIELEDGGPCDGISIGVGFDATPATIVD